MLHISNVLGGVVGEIVYDVGNEVHEIAELLALLMERRSCRESKCGEQGFFEGIVGGPLGEELWRIRCRVTAEFVLETAQISIQLF